MADKKISTKPIPGGKQLQKGPFPVHVSKGVAALRSRNLLSLPDKDQKRSMRGGKR